METPDPAEAAAQEVDAAPEAGPRIVRSVARAAALLKALAARGKPMGLSDLARAIEISKPATFHLLRTLELEGFVAKSAEATYQLDWGLYELGSAVIRSVDLTRVTRLHLDRLAEETGEAVLLSILDGESVLYLDRGQSTESFTMVANVGRRSPAAHERVRQGAAGAPRPALHRRPAPQAAQREYPGNGVQSAGAGGAAARGTP